MRTYFKRLSRDLKTALAVIFWVSVGAQDMELEIYAQFHSNVVFKFEFGEKKEQKMTDFRATAWDISPRLSPFINV